MCVSLDTLHAGLLRQVCMRKTVDEPRRGFVDGLEWGWNPHILRFYIFYSVLSGCLLTMR